MTRLFLIINIILITLLLNLPKAHSQVIWSDGFESGTFQGPWGPVPNNWTPYDGAGASGNLGVDCSVSHSGNCSLRLIYTDLTVGGGPFMDRYFPSQNNLYLRFWIRSSAGFQFASNYTKLPYAPRCESNCAPGTPSWVPTATPAIQWQGQNVPGEPDVVVLNTGRSVSTTWTCIEENINYPGRSATIWINDVQVAQKTGMATTSAMTDDTWRMYQERGIGSLYYDDLVVSTARIGCGGTPPSADLPPGAPDAPRILSVTVQ